MAMVLLMPLAGQKTIKCHSPSDETVPRLRTLRLSKARQIGEEFQCIAIGFVRMKQSLDGAQD